MIDQNPLRIKFRVSNLCVLCCTCVHTYAHAKIYFHIQSVYTKICTIRKFPAIGYVIYVSWVAYWGIYWCIRVQSLIY